MVGVLLVEREERKVIMVAILAAMHQPQVLRMQLIMAEVEVYESVDLHPLLGIDQVRLFLPHIEQVELDEMVPVVVDDEVEK